MSRTSTSRAPRLAAAALPLLLAALAAPASAQRSTDDAGAYVIRLGNDTIAVETFTRTADRLQGRMVVRTPSTQVRDYTAMLAPDGTVTRFETGVRGPADAQPTTRSVIEFGADSATIRITRGDSTQTFRVAAARGSIPLVNLSVALYGPAIARAAGADSTVLSLVPAGRTTPPRAVIRRAGNGAFTLSNIAGSNRVRTDARGRITGWDGSASTLKVVAERVARADVDALAAAFAARDRAGGAFGVASPRDSVQARVGGATVSVNYGRPYLRGRRAFGGMAPWGQVWRTGANQATHFRTDRDLVVGGTPVPAGTYTLWTIPAESGWQLVVNRQTGQWGTMYDAAQDLARIPLRTERVAAPVEQFTISVEPQGEGGVLALAWENTRAFVPFTAK